MKFKLLAATLFLALSAASAESPLPQLRIEPTTGGSIFYVKNISSQALTGYLIELVDYPGSQYSLWQDEIGLESYAPGAIAPIPITPGTEKRIQVGNMTVGAVPDYVKIQAAVYADGSTAGVPEKVAELIERRRFTLQTVRDAIERIQKGQAANLSKDAIVTILKHAAEFMQPTRKSALPPQVAIDRAAGSWLLSQVATRMEKEPVKDTLEKLQAWASELAESKPGLE